MLDDFLRCSYRERSVERESDFVPLLEFTGDGDLARTVGLARGNLWLSVRDLKERYDEHDPRE